MKLSVPDYILSIKPYIPGKPLEALEREYGIDDSIKLASNENPLGPSPMALKAIQSATEKLHRYPDGGGYVLIHKISEYLGLPPHNILLGNGSDEIIGMLTQVLLKPGDEALFPSHSFLMYDISVRGAGGIPVTVPLTSFSIDLDRMADRITDKTRMVFLCNPNNPTGTIIYKKDFEKFIDNIPPHVLVIVDEAYIEFVRDYGCARSIEYIDNNRPLVTLRTFSKAYGLAGLRIGYGVMPKEMVHLLNRIRMPFNTNSLAQIGASAAIEDVTFLENVKRLVHSELAFLQASLDDLGITYFPTQTNFFMIDVKEEADVVFEKMLKQGVIVRSMKSYGYPHYIRINVGLHEENVRFIRALKKTLR
ncbi:MAG: histidinol-phosphate transaminase [Desulfobacterales bacterium]|nr:MAG: histidinol-phosphate transaminase [Desulfobacterales bacterium]